MAETCHYCTNKRKTKSWNKLKKASIMILNYLWLQMWSSPQLSDLQYNPIVSSPYLKRKWASFLKNGKKQDFISNLITAGLESRRCRRGRPGRRRRSTAECSTPRAGTGPAGCTAAWWSRRQTGTASCGSMAPRPWWCGCSWAGRWSRSTHFL